MRMAKQTVVLWYMFVLLSGVHVYHTCKHVWDGLGAQKNRQLPPPHDERLLLGCLSSSGEGGVTYPFSVLSSAHELAGRTTAMNVTYRCTSESLHFSAARLVCSWAAYPIFGGASTRGDKAFRTPWVHQYYAKHRAICRRLRIPLGENGFRAVSFSTYPRWRSGLAFQDVVLL